MSVIDDNQRPGDGEVPLLFRPPGTFASPGRLVIRDLNNRRGMYPITTNADLSHNRFLYTREQIARYLRTPWRYQRELRAAVNYLYCVSPHFRRLIQYFSMLNDLTYVVVPYRLDVTIAKPATVRRNYNRVLNMLATMDLKNQMEKMLLVCLREDIFFGTIWEAGDSVLIQQLPSDWCAIAVIEDNVYNVSFDFSYFDIRQEDLPLFPHEFAVKYELYRQNRDTMRWQELDAPNSFAIKCTKDIPDYAIPPFSGVLRDIFDIEDYKELRKDRAEIENYAMVWMKLGVNDDGDWAMDLDKAVDFYHNLDNVLPDQIGSVLTPMDITKISFEKTHNDDRNSVAEAEDNLFTAAGVSSLLFSNTEASSNSLLLSIRVDQALTWSVVKSIETMLNRFIHRHSFGRNFSMNCLNVSPYNREEYSASMLKAATYGAPTLPYYTASIGLGQSELDSLTWLDNDVLHFNERLIPLMNSNNMSAEAREVTSGGGSGEAGRPTKGVGEISDNGEIAQERGEE